ncbi:MAG: xanthine dehydrogenase family protein molybdopterin-binding subunit [Thermaerobacter sp.]|nr:xanthine dehydrogenase family protein molybdopterin-binding subunit [Thermaerobacter sp.]
MAGRRIAGGPGVGGTTGQKFARKDVAAKVAGLVSYSGDTQGAGMLHARLVRSLYPHARITEIAIAAAQALPGVAAVLTARDVPCNVLAEDPSGTGGGVFTQPVLASTEVRYVGEPLAVVVAASPVLADAAAQLVKVTYEPLPAVFDPGLALADDAPPIHPGGNLCVQWHVNKGNVEEVLAQAPVVIQREYATQFVDHAYLEPEAGSAWLEADGVIVIRAATQVIEHYRRLAGMLNLPHSRVRLIAPYVGGGFGGKEDMTVEPYLALAAFHTRRPVRMVWSRQESLQARPKRHPMRFQYTVAASRDGKLEAVDINILADAGAYALLTPRVLFAAAVVASGPYRVLAARVVARAGYTHNVPSSAFRGFGAMQAAVAYEQIMDELAETLGMDPLELRRKNFLQRGDELATGERVETAVWLPETLNAVQAALGPEPQPSRPGLLVGRGYAMNMQPYGRTVWFGDQAAVWMGLENDGSFHLRAGVTDVGGGQAAVLGQIAAEVLGVLPEAVTVHFGDSALTPLTGGTFATRQLYMSGNAAVRAAESLRERIQRVAATLCGGDAKTVVIESQGVRTARGSARWHEVAAAARQAGVALEVLETFFAESGPGYDNRRGTAARTFPDFTYGCHGCDVEIDPETGQVQILQYVASHDVGRAINPLSVEGQIQGGVAQGIGYALTEEVLFHEGQCLNGTLAQYLIPAAADLPPIRALILESGEGKGPLNARGIGEPAISPVAPAVANAVARALGGARVRSLPITGEKVVDTLFER